jgi:hypothetical protein
LYGLGHLHYADRGLLQRPGSAPVSGMQNVLIQFCLERFAKSESPKLIKTNKNLIIFGTNDQFYFAEKNYFRVYTPFIPKKGDNTETQILYSLGNALTMIGTVVVMTFILIFLYKFRFYKVVDKIFSLTKCYDKDNNCFNF